MKRPNIVLILIDDLGWRDLGCYGSAFYESPNIDRLLAEGMHFTDAYAACPVCSPTRASMLTGQYPARLKLTNYIDWRRSNHPLRGRVIDAPYIDRLPTNQTSLATALGEAGYATWHVGKWHLGYRDTYPQRHGFDLNVGGNECGMPTHGYFAPWHLPNLPGDDVDEGTHLDDYLTDRAIEQVRAAGAEGRAFFLNYWPYLVHTPIQAKDDDIAYFQNKARELGLEGPAFRDGQPYPYQTQAPARQGRVQHRTLQSDPVYAAMVLNLDRNIGRLLDALDEAGVADETLVLLSSDNGGLATGHHPPTCNAPLAFGKGWMEEGGVREPLIARWPGVIAPASVCAEPVTSTDFFPTLLEAAGLDPQPHRHVDGVSLMPALRGQAFTRGPIFWHYPHYSNCGGHPGASIREGHWKLIRFFEGGREVLYHLVDDLGESRDRSDDEPAVLSRLREQLDRWLYDVGALLPISNPAWTPDDHRPGCSPTV